MEDPHNEGSRMPTSIILGHFCEAHGPSIVFTTQIIGLPPPKELDEPEEGVSIKPPITKRPISDAGAFASVAPASGLLASRMTSQELSLLHQMTEALAPGADSAAPPANIAATEASAATPRNRSASVASGGPSGTLTSPSAATRRCAGCAEGSGPDGHVPLFASEAEQMLTVSSRVPSPASYAAAKRAVMRALSCEVSPGREGPVLFTDVAGAVLAVVFKLRDRHARGAARWYSLLVLQPDASGASLLLAADALLPALDAIAADLRAAAERHYDDDRPPAALHVGPNAPSPTAAPAPDAFLPHGAAATHANMMARRRGPPPPMRALEEVVRSPDLLQRLHTRFSGLLLALAAVAHEKRLHRAHSSSTSYAEVRAASRPPPPHPREYGSLTGLQTMWGAGPLRVALTQLLTGNQLVIRGPLSAAKDAAELLGSLLPPSCAVLHRTEYAPAWQCNVLSLPPDAIIPPGLDPNAFCLVDLNGPDPVLSSTTPPARNSRILIRLDELLARRLPAALEHVCLQRFRARLLAGAKVLFRLTRMVESLDDPRVLRLLQALDMTQDDVPVLRFFTTGLRPALLRLHLWESDSRTPPVAPLPPACLVSALSPLPSAPPANAHPAASSLPPNPPSTPSRRGSGASGVPRTFLK